MTTPQTNPRVPSTTAPPAEVEATPDDVWVHPDEARDMAASYIADEQRRSPRVHVEAEVSFESDNNFYTGFAENVSEGGLFVATAAPSPIGTEVSLTFSLPDGDEPLDVRAEVRWLREGDWTQELSPGMGLQFIGLTYEERERVESFVGQRETIFYDA